MFSGIGVGEILLVFLLVLFFFGATGHILLIGFLGFLVGGGLILASAAAYSPRSTRRPGRALRSFSAASSALSSLDDGRPPLLFAWADAVPSAAAIAAPTARAASWDAMRERMASSRRAFVASSSSSNGMPSPGSGGRLASALAPAASALPPALLRRFPIRI